MALPRKDRRRGGRSAPSLIADIAPLVQRTITVLERCPRGASRVDILATMNLQPHAWPQLREALEATGDVICVGRGPGLRHVHINNLPDVPIEARLQARRDVRDAQLEQARVTLRTVLKDQGDIDSSGAQGATGLRADPVRRLLVEMVDEGVVERSGNKRSTRYHWVG
jgi:hypothetical protein